MAKVIMAFLKRFNANSMNFSRCRAGFHVLLHQFVEFLVGGEHFLSDGIDPLRREHTRNLHPMSSLTGDLQAIDNGVARLNSTASWEHHLRSDRTIWA